MSNGIQARNLIHIPFDLLPESKDWKVGDKYRVKMVLQQTSLGEDGAMFEMIDTSSLEIKDRAKRSFLTSSDGVYKA